MRAALVVLALAPAIAGADNMKETCESRPTSYDDAVACGTYYTDLYAKDPSATWHDETLYNAGVMYEEGKAYTAALNAYAQLRRQYPNSKITPKALARSARIYAILVMYDRAADLLEEYAKKYAGEKDAYDALSDAVFYRKAIGDDAKAIANTKYFVKTFGAKKPREAANAHWSLTSLYEKQRDRDAVRKHLQEYVRLYGSKGGYDKLVMAHSMLGLLAWEASCPVKPIDGACVKIVRAKNVCTGAATRLEAVKRNDKEVKAAQAFFASAIKEYDKLGGHTDGDEAGARYYYAKATLTLADATAGAHLVIGDTQSSTQRGELVTTYEALLALGDAATSITATARIGQLLEAMATSFAAGATKTACEQGAVEARAYKNAARRAYDRCLTKASELGWFADDGAGICERGAQRLDPAAFPALRETTAPPTFAATVTATEMLTRP